MALARIISRSEACSRELAILLQSRGYAVETVSPDNVPANAADLELRVDTDSGDRLTASVIARDGERSSTLEFVRQLKSPITGSAAAGFPAAPAVEILAGPVVKSLSDRLLSRQEDRYAENALPQPLRQAGLSGFQPVSDLTSASSQIVSPVTPPQTRWRPIRPVEQSSAPPRIEPGVADAKPDVVPALPTVVPPVPATEPAARIVASANPAAPVESAEVGPVVPQDFPYQTFNRAPSVFGNVALVLTSMALLITLVVGFSFYRSKKSLSNTDKVAPSSATSASDAKGANHSAGGSPSKGLPAVKPATKSAPVGKPAPATRGVGEIKESNRGSLTASHRVRHSGGDDDDLVAKDTVVYLDRRAQPAASKPSASKSRSQSHRDGAIAKNTVTYLNGMTVASKPAK